MVDANLHPVHDTSDGSPEPGIALCLSGGGYRAMLFHAGCLWRLNQLGLLGKLNRISSVSGRLHHRRRVGHELEGPRYPAERRESPLRRSAHRSDPQAAGTTIDEGAIFGGVFLPGTISDHVAGKYDSLLFHGKTMQDLPDEPRFVINATNVQSGVLMRISKPYMRDFRVGQILKPKLPLAHAVAASSAFPPVLSPCEIKVADYGMKFEPATDGEDLNSPPYTTDLILSDGGVYDNPGSRDGPGTV